VDAVGLSLLSGAHMTLFPQVMAALKGSGLEGLLVFGGGIIPDEDVPKLKKKGVHRVFGPGTALSEIVSYLQDSLPRAKEK
jgi:methylmalonyl-CoA mutase C-terminal domain/subunit